MTILKLQNEGDTHTGIVTSCGAVQGQYGEQVEFVFQGGDKLFLPKESADRQLDRLTLDYEGAVGQSLTFSRDHNPKKGAKPYWGISYGARLATHAAASKQESRRIPPPSGAPPQAVTRGSLPFDEPVGGPPIDESPYEEPAQTPREQREASEAGGVDFAKIAKRKSFITFYADTYKMLAGLLPTEDPQAIQAATATCIIQLDRKGLLP